MRHPSLTQFALPHGVNIYGGVAGKMVPHLRQEIPHAIELVRNDVPLMPLPAKQSIQKLAREPKVAEKLKAGELVIEQFEPPPDIVEKIAQIGKPQNPVAHIAK